jgi:hypothetical protein
VRDLSTASSWRAKIEEVSDARKVTDSFSVMTEGEEDVGVRGDEREVTDGALEERFDVGVCGMEWSVGFGVGEIRRV